MKYFAGIDVGGTNTKIGLLDKEGNILKTVSIKTESEKGPENTIRRIWKEVIEIADALSINVESIAGIGVGIRLGGARGDLARGRPLKGRVGT